MAEALTRKQVIQAVWNKFKAIIGNKDISGIGDGTVTGALVGLNGKTIFYKQFDNSNISGSGHFVVGATNKVPPGKYLIKCGIHIPKLNNPQASDLIGIIIQGITGTTWERGNYYKTMGQEQDLSLSFIRQITEDTIFHVSYYSNRNDTLYTESYICLVPLDNCNVL